MNELFHVSFHDGFVFVVGMTHLLIPRERDFLADLRWVFPILLHAVDHPEVLSIFPLLERIEQKASLRTVVIQRFNRHEALVALRIEMALQDVSYAVR